MAKVEVMCGYGRNCHWPVLVEWVCLYTYLRMRACMHVCKSACRSVCIHTPHVHMCAGTQAHMYANKCARMYFCVHATCTCTYLCTLHICFSWTRVCLCSLSAHVTACMHVSKYVCICVPMHLAFYLSVCLSFCLSVYVCLFVFLSVYLSTCLCMYAYL